MQLTHQQMLNLWRHAQGFAPLHCDCAVERLDAIDIDLELARRMRSWYLDLLDNAPLRYLILTDIAPRLDFKPAGQGLKHASLPPDVRRIAQVKYTTSPLPVKTLDLRDDPAAITRLTTPAPGARNISSPSSIALPRWARNLKTVPNYLAARTHNTLIIPENLDVSEVLAITDPGDELYTLAPQALNLIPQEP